MQFYRAKTEKDLGELTASLLLGEMMSSNRVNLAITGGTSPKEVYKSLIPKVKGTDYLKNAHFYNFDEIPYRKEDREGITISEIKKVFLEPAGVKPENIHKLDQHNYKNQDQRVFNDGGMDVMFIGVGNDGHYCGNLPGTTKFGDWTSRIENTQELRERELGEFPSGDINDVPDYYVTMGPRSVMAAKKIIMIATGTRKKEIVKTLMDGVVDMNIPATLLTLHPGFVLIADDDACSLL